MVLRSRDDLWTAIHAERAALADDLAGLTGADWASPSSCTGWTVEQVVAHLTAAAVTGRFAWIRSMLAARFDADVHNDRRLAEQLGPTRAATLQRFRSVVDDTTAPSGHTAAWLGEVVVHGQDIRRPLGLAGGPSVDSATAVAEFFVRHDFTVASRTAAAGLRLEATDGPFAHGDGPSVQGPTVALVMALAGRAASCDDLIGPGVPTLRDRCR